MGLWVDKLIGWFNHFFISKFDECWIPDAGGSINLAGELSHGDIPENAVYIGPLSRFSMNNNITPGLLLAILSGPEPQRSMLEKILEKQLSAYPGKVCIVRGMPGEKAKPADSANSPMVQSSSCKGFTGINVGSRTGDLPVWIYNRNGPGEDAKEGHSGPNTRSAGTGIPGCLPDAAATFS